MEKLKVLFRFKKTGRVKAIGIVKWGKTQKNWLLEPKSEKWAKRRILLKKRKASKKMLAKKRRKRLIRAPASHKTSRSQPPGVKPKEIQSKASQSSEFLTPKFWRNVTLKELKEKLKGIENINKIRSKNNETMLHFLVKYGQYSEMVGLLIKAGVDYKVKDTSYKGKALHYAGIRKDKVLEFTKEILKHDSNLNEHENGTVLQWALYGRAPIEVIKLLLEKGADPHFQHEKGYYSLISASAPNRYSKENFIDPEVIKLLLDYGVDITVKNAEGKTAYDFMKENEDFKKTEIFKKISLQFQNK